MFRTCFFVSSMAAFGFTVAAWAQNGPEEGSLRRNEIDRQGRDDRGPENPPREGNRPPEGRGPFGPPGGFGPGGGAGRLGTPFGIATPGVALLGMSEVRTELKVRPDQTAAVDAAISEWNESLGELMRSANFPQLFGSPAEEREAKLTELRKAGEAAGRKIDESLKNSLNDVQRQRLSQLVLQRQGIQALVRPEIAEKLSLEEAQRKRIQERLPGMSQFPPPSPEDQKKLLAEALDILKADQKKVWTEMVGAEFEFPRPEFGFNRGFGGPGGPPGFGGAAGAERKVVHQHDKDGNGRLNAEERKAARTAMSAGGGGRMGRGGPPGGGMRGQNPPKPGPKIAVSEVEPVSEKTPLYDSSTVRTLFLEFENADWERELSEFKGTDVEVPATLIVDGKNYPEVGVHFRGMSSFMMIGEGSKRSLNVSLDFVHDKQRIGGYKTLNLLNANGDPSFLHTILFFQICREFIPAPKANLVRVVINGESWGVYVSAQQFDKIFVKENFGSGKGSRWKVPGRPGGRGGLDYIGDNVEDYKRHYELKSDDGDTAWKALIALCKTLKETPADKLEAALEPMLDLDGALWFLALDVALINEDGYWTRASDYSIYRDEKGKFHLIPHDANETFHAGGFGGPGGGPGGPRGGGGLGAGPMGPGSDRGSAPGNAPGGERPREGGRGPGGFGGGPGGIRGGVTLDPLVGLDDASKPLRSKLLAVPALRKRYLQHVHTIAKEWLDWNKMGPIVADYEKRISEEVEADTRKLSSFAAFQSAISGEASDRADGRGSLRAFMDARKKFLLSHPEVQKAVAETAE